MLKWLSQVDETDANLHYSSLALNCFSTARKESSLGMKLFITKWLSGDTATGKIMCARKQWKINTCSRWDTENEHLLHVIVCPAQQASTLMDSMISELLQWLRDVHTHPCIISFIRLGLPKWITNRTFKWSQNSSIFSDCSTVNSAIVSQLEIGWYYFLCGMLATELVDLQQSYYTQIGSKRSSNRWATNLLRNFGVFT